MTTLFFILIVLCAVALGFIILVQNPKGGGLSGSIAGFSNQFMGVKQTTDVLEKGTWIFSAVIALLCLFSSFFFSGASTNDDSILNQIDTRQSAPAPAQQPMPQSTAPLDSAKP